MEWWQQLIAKWPDLVINFLGVFAGAALGWWMVTWQMKRQARESEQRDKELVLAYLDRLKIEIRQNEGVARQVRDVMRKCDTAAVDLELVKVIAGATATTVYHEFVSSGLHRRLSRDEEKALHAAYAMAADLRDMANQALPSVRFYSFSGDVQGASVVAENLRRYAFTVLEHMKGAKEMFYKVAADHRCALGKSRENEDPQ